MKFPIRHALADRAPSLYRIPRRVTSSINRFRSPFLVRFLRSLSPKVRPLTFIHPSDARHPHAYRINIPTNVVEPGEKLADRLRFWRRSKVVAA